jgi:PHD/YefM family antitoxin component YafN of YafNO toxin-antitoxin module
LNGRVDAVSLTREQVTSTGSPVGVLVGVDEWESIQDILDWLSEPGFRESLAEARADVEAGRVVSEDELRAGFGVPRPRHDLDAVKYEVLVSASARRERHQIPGRVVRAIIEFVLGDLASAPRRVGMALDRDDAGCFSAPRAVPRPLRD